MRVAKYALLLQLAADNDDCNAIDENDLETAEGQYTLGQLLLHHCPQKLLEKVPAKTTYSDHMFKCTCDGYNKATDAAEAIAANHATNFTVRVVTNDEFLTEFERKRSELLKKLGVADEDQYLNKLDEDQKKSQMEEE